MEQAVAERPISQERHIGQLHMQHDGTVNSSGGQSEKDPLGRWCVRRSTGWRGSIPSDSFRGDHLGRDNFQRPVCRDNLRGSCVRGAFCKYQHSDSDGHDRSRFYHDGRENLGAVANFGNSQICRENQDRDSTSRYSSGGYRSRSPCRRFQSGRCYHGASCRYLHPESTSYDRLTHGVIVEQRQEDEAVRDSCLVGENKHSTLRISQEHGEVDKENSSRPIPFSGEHRSRSPCRNYLRGQCNFGAFCKRWHPVTLSTSGEHDEANMHNHFRVGGFSRDPRSRSLCQSFLRGKCYRGTSCVDLHPVTVQDRTRYDSWGVQQHQGAPVNPHLCDGSIASPLRISLNHERCKNHEIQSHRDMHVVFQRNKEWPTKDGMQLAGNRKSFDITSRKWSYQRQRGSSANDFGGDKRTREVCLQFTKGRCKSGDLCRYLHGYHDYATSNWSDKSYTEAAGHSRNFGITNQNVNTMMAQEHADAKNYKMSLVESVHTESSQIGCTDKETQGRSVDDAIKPNILDHKVHVPMVGYKCEVSGEKTTSFCNSSDNHEDISLWSQPFKRRRSMSQSPITPNNDFHCRNLREYDSRVDLRGGRCSNVGRFQYPDHHSYRYEKPMYHANNQQRTEGEAILGNPCSQQCNDPKLVTSQRHDEVVSQDRQLDQCFRGRLGSNIAIVRKKAEAEFAGCTLKASCTDPNDGELATCSNAVDNITCAAAIDQEVLGSDSTRSSEEHDVSPAAIDSSVLEEGPVGLNNNMGQETNGSSAELMPMIKTYSRKKRKKRGSKSASCEEILKEEVTDASEQGTTTTLCNPNVVSVSGIPVEMMKSASKNNDLENMDMHDHPVKQQKRKWKRKLLCVASCEEIMKEVGNDASNKGTLISSLAETHSTNPDVVSVSGVPVDTKMSDPENGNLGNVLVRDQSVKQKAEKKHRKKRTGSGLCDENKKEEISDASEQGMAISSLVETSCSKSNIVSVTDAAVDMKLSASENNESVNVVLPDLPVIRNVKKKRKNKCPGSGSFEANKEEERSDASKQGMPISSLVEIVSVTGVAVDMRMIASENNELENVLSHDLPVIQKVKKKRKKKCPGSGSFEENKEEISDASIQGMPISCLVETSWSEPNIEPVTGVPVDTNLSAAENKETENVPLHDLPVISKVNKKHKKRCPGSGSFEENKKEEISDSLKQDSPISSLVETSWSKQNIVPVTGVAVDTNLSASENNESENVLLHGLPVKQQENGCRTNKIEKNVEPAVDGTLLVGNTDDHSLQTLQYPSRTVVYSSKRKLLVLDVNGLLADIVTKGEYSHYYKPDIIVSGKGGECNVCLILCCMYRLQYFSLIFFPCCFASLQTAILR